MSNRRGRGATRHQGTLEAPSMASCLVGPSGTSSTTFEIYKYPNIQKTLEDSMKSRFSQCKFQSHEIQSRARSREEDDHGGVQHPHWCSPL